MTEHFQGTFAVAPLKSQPGQADSQLPARSRRLTSQCQGNTLPMVTVNERMRIVVSGSSS